MTNEKPSKPVAALSPEPLNKPIAVSSPDFFFIDRERLGAFNKYQSSNAEPTLQESDLLDVVRSMLSNIEACGKITKPNNSAIIMEKQVGKSDLICHTELVLERQMLVIENIYDYDCEIYNTKLYLDLKYENIRPGCFLVEILQHDEFYLNN